MQTNMGTLDRSVRVIIALAIGALYLTGRISGMLALVLGVVAVVFLVTSAAARCPAYLPLGLSTKKGPPA